MSTYQTSKDRMAEKIAAFSKFGDLGNGGITRLSLSEPALAARAELKRRCEALGMTVTSDDIGNIYATWPGTEDLPRFVMGSHLDSVRSGGNYDGVYGVLSSLEAAETIITDGIKLRHPLTVMVWTNEEGARFEPAMMSSGIVMGKWTKEKMFAVVETGGTVTFGEALEASGWIGDGKNRLNPQDYCAYFEPHIEQGPVLEEEGLQIGVVEGVVGMVNYDIILEGVSSHAGTTPQHYRKDALRAASKTILDLWDKLGAIAPDLVFTTGEIHVKPNIHTVVPNYVKFSLDARHRDMAVLAQVVKVIEELPKDVYGCKLSYEEHWGRKTIEFDAQLLGFVEEATKALGYSYKKMYSGAGHDAQYVSEMLPAVMIFIPSKDGLSHTVVEYSSPEQCHEGANVLLNALIAADAAL
ncbi:MAG: Zn-dependent hydrolase [Clostridiales Family XIII bacterium]|jgi:N-carbamoyl-L-amino-acid hydrolase|nr:Zn-dependent hydrolase [Clostridiales Family XIII bacterium]